jgi:hypothetical protein
MEGEGEKRRYIRKAVATKPARRIGGGWVKGEGGGGRMS